MFSSGSKNLRESFDGPSLSLPVKHFQAAGQNHVVENVYSMYNNVNLGNEVSRKVPMCLLKGEDGEINM